MRTETEMMELILSVAKEDERIRAVYMNGSRTNPNAPKDLFQDYDIVSVSYTHLVSVQIAQTDHELLRGKRLYKIPGK